MSQRTIVLAVVACLGSFAVAEDRKGPLDRGPIGLISPENLQIVSPRCTDCLMPPYGRLYFNLPVVNDDLVAVPKAGEKTGLIWVGPPTTFTGAKISADGRTVSIGGQELPFRTVPQFHMNRSFVNEDTFQGFAGKKLDIGGYEAPEGGIVGRTIWPHDYHFPAQALTVAPLRTGEKATDLVEKADAKRFDVRLLWESAEGASRNWAGLPVLGLLLNGAQGDDDESLGGHFAAVTGIMGPQGEWSNWIVNNFYSLDFESEKALIAAQTPMEKYLNDINSGQSFYRPSDMFFVVLKDIRAAKALDDKMVAAYERFYSHEMPYIHDSNNCTGISMDVIRSAGWNIPMKGPEMALVRLGVTEYIKYKARDKAAQGVFEALHMSREQAKEHLRNSLAAYKKAKQDAKQIGKYMEVERTRLYPRVAFETGLDDITALLGGEQGRAASAFEAALKEDALALLYVHIPQIPSSRAAGAPAVTGFRDLYNRLPADLTKMKKVPVPARPFPPPNTD